METQTRLKEVIAAWLELTKDSAPPGGLEREEALRRASDLRSLLREGKASLPEVLDDDMKDVLFALVGILEEPSENPEERRQEASALFQRLSRAIWTPDEFGEKAELLNRCAVLARRRDPKAFEADILAGAAHEEMPPAESVEQEIEATFQASLPLLHLILLKRFGLADSQAKTIEENLQRWFQRFCRRTDAHRSNWQRALFKVCSEFAADPGRTARTDREDRAQVLRWRARELGGSEDSR